MFSPSDHFVKNQEEFTRILGLAVEAAEREDKLITLGITPTFPSTGYGYIRFDRSAPGVAKQVLEFKEKPDEETAKRYLASGEYSWNSGMFVWKASTILEKFKELLPEIYACLEKIGDAMNTAEEARVIAEIYPMIPSISIDYGILEKSSDVLVISAEFGWNDVGSWDNLGVLYEEDENGNVLAGNQINIDTKNCISLFREAFDCHCGCGKSDHRGDGGCRSGVRQVPCPGCETDCGSVEGGRQRGISVGEGGAV